MSRLLDPLRMPLHGSHLIEASAGTGKTWTIAALYLRLVLGHGGCDAEGGEGGARAEVVDACGPRPLMPADILVMTFTRAATRELSDRIRQRLAQAARCFRGDEPPPLDDAVLAGLLADHADPARRSQAAWRLAQAADAMDEAAVHTIDAWCQRMLREHAFDSGQLFDETLVADEQGLRSEAVRDYWRQAVYPLEADTLDAVLAIWPSVDALEADIARLLPRLSGGHAEGAALLDAYPTGAEGLGRLLADTSEQRRAAVAALKDGWSVRADAMQAWLDTQCARKPGPFSGTKLRPGYYTAWLDEVRRWAAAPQDEMPVLTDAARYRLTQAGLEEALSGKAEPGPWPDHFQAFGALMAALDGLPRADTAARWHAARWVSRRLALLKRQSATFGFADLTERMAQALQGPHGERLRQRILAQYPAALIDEFQDTSPLQYRIFDLVYRVADHDPAHTLLLIGDPKQSIYRFRGADIHSYLQARQATEGRHHVLGTNHRSTRELVAVVNRVFGLAEARPGGGAFAFRQDGAPASLLPFEPVAARGRPERLCTGAGPLPALLVNVDAEMTAKDASLHRMAGHAAQHVVTLLNDPLAGFEQPGRSRVPLRPADIAILVRTGREAGVMRQALRRRGLPSVYLSDQESVFDSPEALDLLSWLRAVAEPRDLRQARRAYACATFDLPLDELQAHAGDDRRWDERQAELERLQQVWQRQGVLAMLRQTVHALGLAPRWLARPDGDRRLTNVLHLAELLQAASARAVGEQGLIRWLAHQVQGQGGAGEGAEERIVRLESDADLVKVVTIHKSKGLEYPVVLLPFAATFRPAEAADRVFDLAGPDGARRTVLQAGEAELAQAEAERLREDLRLMYVALTRARHALWLGVSALANGRSRRCGLHRSALGHLLGATEDTGPQDIHVLLMAWTAPDTASAEMPAAGEGLAQEVQRRDVLVQEVQGQAPVTAWQAPRSRAALRPVAVYDARFERHWSIGSFSALVRDLPVGGTPAMPPLLPISARQAALMGDGLDDVGAPSAAATAATAAAAMPAAPWHRFPRGALPGNFLHEQMEWLAQDGFALRSDPFLAQTLARRCERQGWGHLADDVLDWLDKVVGTPLPPLGSALEVLGQAVPEMEFWLPSDGLRAEQVDEVCRSHLWPGRERPVLPQRVLTGMLMGFADLVVAHGGRYWVLDYKSNALGPTDGHYHPDALVGAVLQHRFDVQGQIYLQALHRLLRQRLGPTYEPAAHLGGAVFLFLRGIATPQAGCCLVPAVPAALDALDAALAGGSEAAP